MSAFAHSYVLSSLVPLRYDEDLVSLAVFSDWESWDKKLTVIQVLSLFLDRVKSPALKKMPNSESREFFQLVRCFLEKIFDEVRNNMRITIRFREIVHSIGQYLPTALGTLLFSLVSNYAYDKEKLPESKGIWLTLLASFLEPSYMQLGVVTVVIWLLTNQLFVTVRSKRVSEIGRPQPRPQHAGNPDPQEVWRPTLAVIYDPELRILFGTGNLGQFCHFQQGFQQIVSLRHNLALTVHVEEPLLDLEAAWPAERIVHGSQIFHKRFEFSPRADEESLKVQLDDLRVQIMRCMRMAFSKDKDCTFQLGSFAVLKCTETGFKWWKLDTHSTPTISKISRSTWNLSNLVSGGPTTWLIRGFNLQASTLKAATKKRSEKLQVLQILEMQNGEDRFLCEEPQLVRRIAPMFKEPVYIYASRDVTVEDDTTIAILSEPISVQTAYWISVLQSLIPSSWTVFMITSLALVSTTRLGFKATATQDGFFATCWKEFYISFGFYMMSVFIVNIFWTLLILAHHVSFILYVDDTLDLERASTLEEDLIDNNSLPNICAQKEELDRESTSVEDLVEDVYLPMNFLQEEDGAHEMQDNGVGATNVDEQKPAYQTGNEKSAPRSDIPSGANSPASVSINKELSGMHILLVDDDPAMQRLFSMTLKRLGATVTVVGDGLQAVTAVAENVEATRDDASPSSNMLQFDLVLMDCEMPVMDGYNATKAIRVAEENTNRHIPIVGLMAHASMASDEERCLSVGMDAYLTKPIDCKLMLTTIRGLLSGSGNSETQARRDLIPKTRTIVIGLAAHKEWRIDAFAYVLHNLVEQVPCKVFVVCCLSDIIDPMGVTHRIREVSDRTVDKEVHNLFVKVNHFVRKFRELLTDRQVELEIRVGTGSSTHGIIVQSAKVLHADWVVFDRNFAHYVSDRIKFALECNLVIVEPEPNTDDLSERLVPGLVEEKRHIDAKAALDKNWVSSRHMPRLGSSSSVPSPPSIPSLNFRSPRASIPSPPSIPSLNVRRHRASIPIPSPPSIPTSSSPSIPSLSSMSPRASIPSLTSRSQRLWDSGGKVGVPRITPDFGVVSLEGVVLYSEPPLAAKHLRDITRHYRSLD